MELGEEPIALTVQAITCKHYAGGRRRDGASFEREDNGDEGYDGGTRPTILLSHRSSCTCRYLPSHIHVRGYNDGVMKIARLSLLGKGYGANVSLLRAYVVAVEISAETRPSGENATRSTSSIHNSSVLPRGKRLVYLIAINRIKHSFTKYCIPGFPFVPFILGSRTKNLGFMLPTLS